MVIRNPALMKRKLYSSILDNWILTTHYFCGLPPRCLGMAILLGQHDGPCWASSNLEHVPGAQSLDLGLTLL